MKVFMTEPSYTERTVKVGSKETRLTWGRRRLGVSVPTEKTETVTKEESVESNIRRDKVYSEQSLGIKKLEFGKIFTESSCTDFCGPLPVNHEFTQDGWGWDGAGMVPLKHLDKQIASQQLTDRTGLFDPPITFSCQGNNSDNGFRLSSHYQLRENILLRILGNYDVTHEESNRYFVNYEQLNIGGHPDDPYDWTGYDVVDELKHPHFWVIPKWLNNEHLQHVVNPRYPMSYLSENRREMLNIKINLKETWGFPETYEHSDEYLPLAAKLLTTLYDKPKNWRGCIAVINGFQEEDSQYQRAVDKLDFMRFMNDLRGKWIRFSTSPNMGERDTVRECVVFADPEYLQNGVRYSDDLPIVYIDAQKPELGPREVKVLVLLRKQFSGTEIPGTPRSRYMELQKEIESVLS